MKTSSLPHWSRRHRSLLHGHPQLCRVVTALACTLPLLALSSVAFADLPQLSQLNHNLPPGLLYGLWDGLLAPYTLILRWFMEIQMYTIPNAGWTYDLGFLIGVMFSLPVGWIAMLILVGWQFVVHGWAEIAHLFPQ